MRVQGGCCPTRGGSSLGRTAERPYPATSPDSPVWLAQMAALSLPPCDAAGLQRRLYDEYRIEVPVIEWGGRQLVRVSVQGYNTAEDVEALLRGLADLLPKATER